MARIIVEHVFDPPVSEADLATFAKRLDACLELRGAAWRRSNVATDGRRMTCEFDAPDAEAVRQSLRAAAVPFERAWTSQCFAVEDFPEALEKLRKLTVK